MATILLSKEPCHMDSFENMFGFPLKHVIDIKGCRPKVISPYRPYLVCEGQPTPTDRSVLIMSNNPRISPLITEMGINFGPENTLGMAEVMSKVGEHAFVSTGLLGEHTHHREEAMEKAVREYRESLLKYREALKNKAPRHDLKEEVMRKQANFNRKFKETAFSANKKRARILKRSPLRDVKRGLNMARTGKRFVAYDLEHVLEASWLVRFGKYGKVLGPAVATIDFGFRAADIGASAAAGENWEREAFTECLSFAVGTVAGSFTAEVLGFAAMTFLVATPSGWVMLLVGAGVAGVAGLVGLSMDDYVKKNGNSWYDSIMKHTLR